jgi:hypothetical protein
MNILLSLSLALSLLSASGNVHSAISPDHNLKNSPELVQERDEKYEQLKKKDYAILTEPEKLYFKNHLINLLKKDVTYQEYLKLKDEHIAQYLSRKKPIPDTLRKAPKEREARIEYFRKKGLADPVKYVDHYKKIAKLLFSVFAKYPELRTMDRRDRFEVIRYVGNN